jgi:hypothetical protein
MKRGPERRRVAEVVLTVAVVVTAFWVPADAVVAGSNGRIAYASFRGTNEDIFAIDSDGAVDTRLTQDLTVSFRPSWSPDGISIAFVSWRPRIRLDPEPGARPDRADSIASPPLR